MGNFSEKFKFMTRYKQSDFSNERTVAHYKEVFVKMVEKKFGKVTDELI